MGTFLISLSQTTACFGPRYRGLTHIRDAGGKLLVAQIDFPDAARNPVAVDLAAQRALPLQSCEG